jgi:hypothetical protein
MQLQIKLALDVIGWARRRVETPWLVHVGATSYPVPSQTYAVWLADELRWSTGTWSTTYTEVDPVFQVVHIFPESRSAVRAELELHTQTATQRRII